MQRDGTVLIQAALGNNDAGGQTSCNTGILLYTQLQFGNLRAKKSSSIIEEMQ
jgi:hypothetical protein